MSDSLQKDLKQYYKTITDGLLCGTRQKKSFISQLDGDIRDYIAEKPSCSMDEIKQTFGTAEEIVSSFAQTQDIVSLSRTVNVKKAIVAALVVAVLIWLLFAVFSLLDVHEEAHGYMTEGWLLVHLLTGGRME